MTNLQPKPTQSAGKSVWAWVALVLALLFLARQGMPERDRGPYDLAQLAAIPVSADGRVKPLDTVARVSLMIISDRQTFTDSTGKRRPAIQWLADIIARPDQARKYEVFRIDNPDVLSLFGLTHDDGKRFSFDRLMTNANEVTRQARLASEVRAKDRNPYQRDLLRLFRNMTMYVQLTQMDTPYAIPPLTPGEQWRPFSAEADQFGQTGAASPAATQIEKIFAAYAADQPETFNRELAGYHEMLKVRLSRDVRKARFEVFFNRFSPFYQATILYVLIGLLGCLAFLMRCWNMPGAWNTLFRVTMTLLALTFILHTFGLVARIWLQGRPPVTNLYSSAVFIGWGCVLLSIFLEWTSRLGLGTVVAAVVGTVTLIVAHHLGSDGDTMEMMQAVLDSNFWLATHVITITAGYSATFLAGALAIVFILLGVFTRVLTPELVKSLTRMVYGVVCFALFLSFIGTVLGGIWADQSWGRFWGWDPKENGALLIVLITAIILHARWAGLVQHRGIMNLAVSANIVTAWSWFGTNMLGVGLHSYGFMDSAVFWMLVFVFSQLLIIAAGMLPLRMWRSFRDRGQPPMLDTGRVVTSPVAK